MADDCCCCAPALGCDGNRMASVRHATNWESEDDAGMATPEPVLNANVDIACQCTVTCAANVSRMHVSQSAIRVKSINSMSASS